MSENQGLRDALRAVVAEYHATIDSCQQSPMGVPKAILAGAKLANSIDALLDQPQTAGDPR